MSARSATVLVASPAYIEEKGAPAAPAELRGCPTIAFTGLGSGGGAEWRFGADPRSVVHIRPRLVLNSGDAAIAAAEAGLGVTRVLSYQVRDAVTAGRLRTVLGAHEPPPLPVSLVFQAGRAGSPNLRAFVELGTQRLRAALWQ